MDKVLCDVHGHFLPGIDDGAKDLSESLAMLEKYEADGVLKAFATPHFFGIRHPKEFKELRERAFLELQQSNKTKVEIKCGAEVAYFPGIASIEAELLSYLTLGNSRYLLLELPFGPWDPMILEDIQELLNKGYHPIMAHLERFCSWGKRKMIQRIQELPVGIQVNADSLLIPADRKYVFKRIPPERIDYIGSDTHHSELRPERLQECFTVLTEAGEEKAISRWIDNANRLFDRA